MRKANKTTSPVTPDLFCPEGPKHLLENLQEQLVCCIMRRILHICSNSNYELFPPFDQIQSFPRSTTETITTSSAKLLSAAEDWNDQEGSYFKKTFDYHLGKWNPLSCLTAVLHSWYIPVRYIVKVTQQREVGHKHHRETNKAAEAVEGLLLLIAPVRTL